jgi:hypothetical protein
MSLFTDEEKKAAAAASSVNGPLWEARMTHKSSCICPLCVSWTILWQIGNRDEVDSFLYPRDRTPERYP